MDIISKLVANNAAWIHEASAALGLQGEYTSVLWQCAADMPPIFPNADVMAGTEAEQYAAIESLTQRRAGRVCAVKDAWARLDLSRLGFEPLFESNWIYRDAVPLEMRKTDLEIRQINTASELHEFAVACNGKDLADVYSPQLLNRADIAWITARRAGTLVGGVTAIHAHGLNGINNLFSSEKADADALIRAAVNAFPAAPACGYEGEDTLAPFLSLGFRTVGKLRVWLRQP